MEIGQIFSKPKAPKPAPPPPTRDTAADSVAEKDKLRRLAASGAQQTMTSGPLGVATESTGKKTLGGY